MDYFKILNLNKEPFSNSPDPEYFFQSRQHRGCLQKLELSIRLRRGLNVVIGDVGTGKTTLCRQLIRRFSLDDEYETHLILDPSFKDSYNFLTILVGLFKEGKIETEIDEFKLKEIIKNHIFQKGVDEKKTVVLIIDEGQKIPTFCLESLREFLNYETNENKLLQIVIFAQKEFEKTLNVYQNFADRINLYHLLEPLNFRDTRRMIKFRIKQSSVDGKTPVVFSYPALWAIYRTTGGYPRRIINLCHQCILAIIIQNRSRANWFLVHSCYKRSFPRMFKKRRGIVLTAVIAACFVALLTAGLSSESFKIPAKWRLEGLLKADIKNGKLIHTISVQEKSGTVNEKKETADIVKEKLTKPVQKVQAEQNIRVKDIPVKKDIHKVAEKKPETENTIPPVLGRVVLKNRETLWRLVEKVYGVYKYKYMKALKKVNPEIVNPDNVEAGSVIYLPAIPARVTLLPDRVWWVKIEEKDRLEEGINLLRSYPEDAPKICMIPYWNSISGLKFAVLLKGYFYDSATAAERLIKLPESFVGKGKVISGWEKDTVFFSDPFFGIGG